MKKVGYRGANIHDSIVFVKDASELAIDLAFTAVLYGNRELAQEVLTLEQRVADARYDARIALMLAAKRADDAERLVGVFNVLDGGIKITGAAADIAQIVLEDIGVPHEIRSVLSEAREVTGRAVVHETSEVRGKALQDLDLERDPGVNVIALRRENTWYRRPEPDEQILEGDVLIFAGLQTPVHQVHERIAGDPFVPPQAPPPRDIDGLEEAVDTIIDMKDQAELAIGLAYTASLFDIEPIAAEVSMLERRSDELQKQLEDWVLNAAGSLEDPTTLRGLLHLATAGEVISDAALQIVEVVLRDVDMPAVYSEALAATKEVITSVEIEEGSDLDGETVEDLITDHLTGMVALAVRHDSTWTYDPDEDHVLEGGDILYARGPPEGDERLRQRSEA